MSSYHWAGLFAAATFMLTVIGLCYQYQFVLDRRNKFSNGLLLNELPTSILSLNQLTSIYLACYSFFLYGITVRPINHYLIWPRFLAMLVLLLLFYQLVLDRKDRLSNLVFFSSAIALIGGFLFAAIGGDYSMYGKRLAQGLVILATIVLAQGYTHQIILIRSSGRTGAVSIKFHQCVLMTAISTVMFGLVIGWKDGWPLILLASTSATLKLVTLWHFRWVRVSDRAKKIRALNNIKAY